MVMYEKEVSGPKPLEFTEEAWQDLPLEDEDYDLMSVRMTKHPEFLDLNQLDLSCF